MCVDAVAACLDALVRLDDRDHLHARVNPSALIVDEAPVGGAGTMVEQELARRLHRAGVAAVAIDRAATRRDLTRFCCDLLAVDSLARGADPHGDAGAHAQTLQDVLEQHGVDKIAVQMAHRPEVMPIVVPDAPMLTLLEQERNRRQAAVASGGPVTHLYPPDKGWIRVDPGAAISSVSLADLALLVDDPGALATMLMRLTDEELPEADAREVALSQKFSDLATLFNSLDPRLARMMFSRLSQAVLNLDEHRRRELLRRTILPALLDGKVDGTVLRDFPDVDLADSLCLLLDLETAAPEVLSTALERLQLPDDRRAAVAPLLEERIRQRSGAGASATAQRGADEYARRLIDVGRSGVARSFGEFAAFDLSVDADTVSTVNALVEAIRTTDVSAVQLRCLGSLVALEPNPAPVARFLAQAVSTLGGLEQEGRWDEVARWAVDHHVLAAALREARPDVSDAIDCAMAAFCTPARVARIVDLEPGAPDTARALASAFGPAMIPSMLHLLDEAPPPRWRAAVQLLCADAARVAPLLVGTLDHATPPVARAIARVLGQAGGAHARRLGDLLSHADDQVVREALRALTKIGSAPAAALVAARVRGGQGWIASAAEEALWHFPAAEARRQARELLDQREFVLRQPETAGRLLDRLSQNGAADMVATLAGIASLRFRLWNPALVRVARKAHTLAEARP
jgi:hypothetical protein